MSADSGARLGWGRAALLASTAALAAVVGSMLPPISLRGLDSASSDLGAVVGGIGLALTILGTALLLGNVALSLLLRERVAHVHRDRVRIGESLIGLGLGVVLSGWYVVSWLHPL